MRPTGPEAGASIATELEPVFFLLALRVGVWPTRLSRGLDDAVRLTRGDGEGGSSASGRVQT